MRRRLPPPRRGRRAGRSPMGLGVGVAVPSTAVEGRTCWRRSAVRSTECCRSWTVARSAGRPPFRAAALAARAAVSRVSSTSWASRGRGVRVGTNGTRGASSSRRMPHAAVGSTTAATAVPSRRAPGHAPRCALGHGGIIARGPGPARTCPRVGVAFTADDKLQRGRDQMTTAEQIRPDLEQALAGSGLVVEDLTITPAGRRRVVKVLLDRDLGDVDVVTEAPTPSPSTRSPTRPGSSARRSTRPTRWGSSPTPSRSPPRASAARSPSPATSGATSVAWSRPARAAPRSPAGSRARPRPR